MRISLGIIVTLIVLQVCSLPAYSQDKSVSLAYLSYPPYYAADLPNGGPLTEIVEAAFISQGYQVSRKQLPWSRALQWTQDGKYDALYSAWYRQDREEFFAFSEPLPGNELVLFKRKNSDISFKTYADLKPYKIGIVRGYANPPGFDEAGLMLEAVTSDKQNLLKLAGSRIDLVLADKALGNYVLATEMPSAKGALIDWIEPPLAVEKQYLMFSKKATDYMKKKEDFDRGLKLITDSGKLQSIIDRHGL